MVKDVQALFTIDYKNLIIGILLIIATILAVWKIWDEIQKRTGIETKWVRSRREQKELLAQTVKNLTALQQKHEIDENEIKKTLDNFINETRAENNKLREEMRQYAENRVKDRAVSIDRERRLNSRIDNIIVHGEERDGIIESIGGDVKFLTQLFVDKEIEDIRWFILNFTSALSNGRQYNLEAFNHIFKMHDKYERILEENNMENGLVKESMTFIKEKYQEKLKHDT